MLTLLAVIRYCRLSYCVILVFRDVNILYGAYVQQLRKHLISIRSTTNYFPVSHDHYVMMINVCDLEHTHSMAEAPFHPLGGDYLI